MTVMKWWCGWLVHPGGRQLVTLGNGVCRGKSHLTDYYLIGLPGKPNLWHGFQWSRTNVECTYSKAPAYARITSSCTDSP